MNMRSVMLVGLGTTLGYFQGIGNIERVSCLTAAQREILSHLSIVYLDDGSGAAVNKTIRLTGANLQVVNGTGMTDTQNGIGNLVLGYNELFGAGDRTGSHNLVTGSSNDYSSYGGVLSGSGNGLHGPFSSILGGSGHAIQLGGGHSVVLGGGLAVVEQGRCVVVGGRANVAAGTESVVLGGEGNRTDSDFSVSLGGASNQALGIASTICGGSSGVAGGTLSVVTGGQSNQANGDHSSVGGGLSRTATGSHDFVAGTLFEDN